MTFIRQHKDMVRIHRMYPAVRRLLDAYYPLTIDHTLCTM